jgi:mono/diheme cytochrome c family protein
MRNFVLGVVITILALLFGGLGLALLGFFPTRANITPPDLESRIAMSALDNSVDRHAPRAANPVPPTDENLLAGLKVYTMNCAVCHGDLDGKPAVLGKSLYPPPPNFIMHPDDDPEWHVNYVIRTGVRYTGMPAWDTALSDPDIWKVTAFLTRTTKLPPAVQEYWKKISGVPPPTGESGGHDHEHDHK